MSKLPVSGNHPRIVLLLFSLLIAIPTALASAVALQEQDDELAKADLLGALKNCESAPSESIECTFVIEETAVHPVSDMDAPVFRRQSVRWKSRGWLWKATVQESYPTIGESKEWTEYWDGQTYYVVAGASDGSLVCQIHHVPQRGGMEYDVVGLMNRVPGYNFVTKGSLAELASKLHLIESSKGPERSEYLLTNSDDSVRVRVATASGGTAQELESLEVRWGAFDDAHVWQPSMSIRFEVEKYDGGAYQYPMVGRRVATIAPRRERGQTEAQTASASWVRKDLHVHQVSPPFEDFRPT